MPTILEACITGDLKAVQKDFNSRRRRRTYKELNDLLFAASVNGHLDIVKLLIKNRANHIEQALKYAIDFNHIEVIRYMWNMTILDTAGLRPRIITHACSNSDPDVMRLIFDTPHLDGRLLRLAISRGNLPLVQYLISKYKIKDVTRALFNAVESGKDEIFRWLLPKVDKKCLREIFRLSCFSPGLRLDTLFFLLTFPMETIDVTARGWGLRKLLIGPRLNDALEILKVYPYLYTSGDTDRIISWLSNPWPLLCDLLPYDRENILRLGKTNFRHELAKRYVPVLKEMKEYLPLVGDVIDTLIRYV